MNSTLSNEPNGGKGETFLETIPHWEIVIQSGRRSWSEKESIKLKSQKSEKCFKLLKTLGGNTWFSNRINNTQNTYIHLSTCLVYIILQLN